MPNTTDFGSPEERIRRRQERLMAHEKEISFAVDHQEDSDFLRRALFVRFFGRGKKEKNARKETQGKEEREKKRDRGRKKRETERR